jgi:hypothetical protein
MVELRAPQPLRKAGHWLLGVMVYFCDSVVYQD